MQIQVVTNNILVREILVQKNISCVYLEEKAENSLLAARDLVVQGWGLAADPLAGYRVRFNPYHTIFLQSGREDAMGEDVLRLEKAVLHLQNPARPPGEDTKAIRRDYQQLDFSLAVNTLKELMKYDEYEPKKANG